MWRDNFYFIFVFCDVDKCRTCKRRNPMPFILGLFATSQEIPKTNEYEPKKPLQQYSLLLIYSEFLLCITDEENQNKSKFRQILWLNLIEVFPAVGNLQLITFTFCKL